MKRKFAKLAPAWGRRFVSDDRGAVFLSYAILAFTLLVALGTGLDASNAVEARYRLDLAADAGAVACGETWQSSMEAQFANGVAFATAQTNANKLAASQGQAAFLAQAGWLMSDLTTGATPIVAVTNGAGASSAPGATVTCNVTYQASLPTYIMKIAGIRSVAVASNSMSTVELPPYTQVFLILDTSASMMVGSTPGDQLKVANAVLANYNQYGTSSTNSLLSGSDKPPCAFACHDTSPFKVSDMQNGEVVAHQQGATTRFDVMKQALVNDPVTMSPSYCYTSTNGAPSTYTPCANTGANNIEYEGLLPYIRDNYQQTNARANLGTFSYMMYGFNEGINGDEPSSSVLQQDQPDYSQYFVPTAAQKSTYPTGLTQLTDVSAGVNQLTIGLNTHLNPPADSGHQAVLPALVNLVGSVSTTNTKCPPGACSTNPLKFVIIVTDGVNSDRNWNWNHSITGSNVPSGITQKTAGTNANFCALWGAKTATSIPSIDGTLSWQGSGGGATYGAFAECANSLYSPGFLTAAVKPSQNYDGANSVYYAGPILTTYCTQMKNAGATIAVLETPYVPLTGQDPGVDFPYESMIQQLIYPQGNPVTHPVSPTATAPYQSAVSNALFQCATNQNYYFQATSDQAIANGFITLFNTFVGQWVHITQ